MEIGMRTNRIEDGNNNEKKEKHFVIFLGKDATVIPDQFLFLLLFFTLANLKHMHYTFIL